MSFSLRDSLWKSTRKNPGFALSEPHNGIALGSVHLRSPAAPGRQKADHKTCRSA